VIPALPPDEATKRPARRINWRRVLPSVLTILITLGIGLAVFLLRDRLPYLRSCGLLGIFLISVLSNATLILPVPGLALVYWMGSVYSPVAVGLAAGFGGALGELTGYAAGRAGAVVIEDRRRYEQVQTYMRRYGLLTVVVLSVIPNPFLDLAGIASGALKLPMWQFLGACILGKTIKTTIVAFAGAGSVTFIQRLIMPQ
jgi:membrane protein YqaA with SNARE-associated domain